MYNLRLQKLQSQIKDKKADAILVTNPTNIFYLTGLKGASPREREFMLLVGVDKVSLIMPKLYSEEANNLNVVIQHQVEVLEATQGKGFISILHEVLKKDSTLLFEEDDLKVNEFMSFKRKLGCKFRQSKSLVAILREEKDSIEIELIKKAVEITDSVFNELVDFLRSVDYTEYTEQDIAEKIRTWGLEFGGDCVRFEIVASGKNSSLPHHQTSLKHLKENEPLLLDFGIGHNGYSADLSRTIFLGKPSNDFVENYNHVLECNELCVSKCSAKTSFADIHNLAVDCFKKYKLENNFIHSIGHGIGLDIHEMPFVRLKERGKLKSGNIITIEPGVYFEGKYGIRIEDVVLMTKNGHQVLSGQENKKLIII